jgi:activator of 2-hydroxyglutaryl-CoA dehydratase
VVEGFVGIDGGSTSTKAVLLSKDHKRRILAKTYQLSKGNPIEDTIEVMGKLDAQIRDQGADAEDSRRGHHRLRQGHSERRDRRGCRAGRNRGPHQAGLHFYDDVDVICDVGGQDIKIIILKRRPRQRISS